VVATVENQDVRTNSESKERESSLKVGITAYDLISKVARLRNKSIANLFREQDVETFWTLLYVEELRKESERMKKRKK
jgi:hypothetical protein